MSKPKKSTSKKSSTVTKNKVAAKREVAVKKAATSTGKFLPKKLGTPKYKVVRKPPKGYIETPSGLAIPSYLSQPVPAAKLRAGFDKAKNEINALIKEIAGTMVESYSINEIELTASFSADGKFMGFGVGGAASIKIKIKPED